MSVFDLLTEEDKEKIIEYIGLYGPVTDNASVPSLNDIELIMREWDTQKSKYLQKLFGNQLILNRPYTYSITEDGVIREIEEAITEEGEKYYWPMKNWARHAVCGDPEVPGTVLTMVSELFQSDTLANNSYGGPALKVDFLNGETWKIATGMKPMKILHKVVTRYGGENEELLYENFRQWHSQLLNQIHLDGILSLSIHPLDFMTMSDNGGSWNSCMRWQADEDNGEPGDYRTGTLECMNSPYVIVAYLHNPKRKMSWWSYTNREEEERWNKKKWRELFIIQNGAITEVKGYPFQDENLTNTTLMWIKELAHNNLGWEYDDIEVNMSQDYPYEGKDYLFKYHTGSYMYNDFGTLSIHRGRVNIRELHKRAANVNDEVQITEYLPRGATMEHVIFDLDYGGVATCMNCGAPILYHGNKTNVVFCDECEHSAVCPCCGEYYTGDGFYVSAYEDPICYGCYEDECTVDDLSEETEYSNSLVDIYFRLGEDEDGDPVFYRNYVSTLEPTSYDNFAYGRIFNKLPMRYSGSSKKYFYGYAKYYVTYDMIKNYGNFEDAFDIDLEDPDLFEDYDVAYPDFIIKDSTVV